MSCVGEESWKHTANMMAIGQKFNYAFFKQSLAWLSFEDIILSFSGYSKCYLIDSIRTYIPCAERPSLTNEILRNGKLIKIEINCEKIELIFRQEKANDVSFFIIDSEKVILEDKIDEDELETYGYGG